jgi:hypothetical protein
MHHTQFNNVKCPYEVTTNYRNVYHIAYGSTIRYVYNMLILVIYGKNAYSHLHALCLKGDTGRPTPNGRCGTRLSRRERETLTNNQPSDALGCFTGTLKLV